MAFKSYTTSRGAYQRNHRRTKASIYSQGLIALPADRVAEAGMIPGPVHVMIDMENGLLGIRQARAGESSLKLSVDPKSPDTMRIWARGALKEMGIASRRRSRQAEVRVDNDQRMLIVSVS